ncbi:MAG: DNA polymerase IV [Spirochaetales bacterium]
MSATPVFLHVDLDAFYASVEQCDKPELRGKAVIVGGSANGRGVVSACSYEARAYGVHSAMPAAEARRRAPHAVFLPVRMRRYQEVSHAIMRILAEYTPVLQQISVDEAFLDMTGTERLLGDPAEVAKTIRAAIRSRFGLAASVGVGPSRFIAKMASDFNKPDGMHVVVPGGEQDFVLGLDLGDLWGLGRKTHSRLVSLGITRVDELRSQPIERLRGHFGPSLGAFLYKICRGIDPGILAPRRGRHSISTETTFERDVRAQEILESVLLELCEQVMFRAYAETARSRIVTVKLRTADFQTKTARRSQPAAVSNTDDLFRAARELLLEKWDGSPLRLIGAGLDDVSDSGEAEQGELCEELSQANARRRKLEQAVFALRERGVDIHKAGGAAKRSGIHRT